MTNLQELLDDRRLLVPVEKLNIISQAKNVLTRENIHFLGQLLFLEDKELCRTSGLGRPSLQDIKDDMIGIIGKPLGYIAINRLGQIPEDQKILEVIEKIVPKDDSHPPGKQVTVGITRDDAFAGLIEVFKIKNAEPVSDQELKGFRASEIDKLLEPLYVPPEFRRSIDNGNILHGDLRRIMAEAVQTHIKIELGARVLDGLEQDSPPMK